MQSVLNDESNLPLMPPLPPLPKTPPETTPVSEDLPPTPSRITGTQVAYYFICHKKLWLFTRGIRLETEHENVQLGKMLHEDRYQREKKEVLLGNIKLDFIQTKDGLEIHEIKKTKKMEDAHLFQLLFYLLELKNHGVHATGTINYPLLNQKQTVTLSSELEAELQEHLICLQEIIAGQVPTVKRKRICSKCAYLEFCFSATDGE